MAKHVVLKIVLLSIAMATAGFAVAGDQPDFILEVEAGPTWQSSNDVQVPNTSAGTRFSLKDLAGQGPWFAGRVYFTWNISPRNGLRLLLAPLSYTETGVFDEPVEFRRCELSSGDSHRGDLQVQLMAPDLSLQTQRRRSVEAVDRRLAESP